jgi:hypothetical protein
MNTPIFFSYSYSLPLLLFSSIPLPFPSTKTVNAWEILRKEKLVFSKKAFQLIQVSDLPL